MRKTSYAETINSVKLMVSGLKGNAARVGKRGLDATFITKLESAQTSAMKLDNEQEDLKAKLKTKTADLEKTIDELNKLMSEAKKVVKLEMEKESWKSFGIQDAR